MVVFERFREKLHGGAEACPWAHAGRLVPGPSSAGLWFGLSRRPDVGPLLIGPVAGMQPDWVTALKKGQQLLKAARAGESIAHFERSLKASPGEYGTASGEEASRSPNT